MGASPLVAAINVENMEMVVVFPAPLGPRRLKISPSSISKEMSFTAAKSAFFYQMRSLQD